MLNSQKGVTLIALVITIIILLILAGITITLALQPDGIVERSQTARDKYKEAESTELTNLNTLWNKVNTIYDEVFPDGE